MINIFRCKHDLNAPLILLVQKYLCFGPPHFNNQIVGPQINFFLEFWSLSHFWVKFGDPSLLLLICFLDIIIY